MQIVQTVNEGIFQHLFRKDTNHGAVNTEGYISNYRSLKGFEIHYRHLRGG